MNKHYTPNRRYGNFRRSALTSGILALLVMMGSTAHGKPISINVVSIPNIADGDTFTITTDTQSKVLVGKRFIIRIKGIDTPEIKSKCRSERDFAKQAKVLLTETLNNAMARGDKIEVVSYYRDKFGRLVGDVFVLPKRGGKVIDVGGMMLNRGLALPYSASKRKNNYGNYWCCVGGDC